jgi:hypothetical protein
MASLVFPSRRIRQPKGLAGINPAFSRGLLGVFSAENVSDGFVTSGTVTPLLHEYGLGLKTTSSIIKSVPAGTTGQWSCLYVGRAYNPAGQGIGCFGLVQSNNAYAGMVYVGSGGNLNFYPRNGSSVSGTSVGWKNTVMVVCARYNGAKVDVLARSSSGLSEKITGDASGSTAYTSIRVNGLFGVGGFSMDSSLGAVWTTELDDSQMLALVDNPWQIFAPERRVIYFPVSSGGHWILRDGTWDDTGIWDDTEFWIDSLTTVLSTAGVDALIRRAGITQTIAADALIRRLVTGSLNFDAAAKAIRLASAQIDAAAKKSSTAAGQIDAVSTRRSPHTRLLHFLPTPS